MYEIQFIAADDADWSEAVEIINDDTNLPLDEATNASFELQVTDCGQAVLTASTDAGTLTKPQPNIIAWHFTEAQMGCLCKGTTYKVGCRMTTDAGVLMLFTGTLAYVDGGMS